MKKFILLICILLINFIIYGQERNSLNDIINHSLNLYVNKVDTLVEKRTIVKKFFQEKYVNMDGYPLNFILDNNLKKELKQIRLFDDVFLKNILKKGTYVIFFDGIDLKSNRIMLSFSSRYVILKKGGLNISISDGGVYTYEYSNEKQEWYLIEEKYIGI